MTDVLQNVGQLGGDEPGLRKCCCTDAVVAHDLGNDGENLLQAYGSLANRRTEGKNSAESLQESELRLHLGLYLGRSVSPFCFSPDPFFKPVSFACICLKNKERKKKSHLSLRLAVAPL